jgi:5-dehydro-2-deoxygluconokinase
MNLGFDQPLYILPFDHRHSYGSEVFGFHEPLSVDQIAVVADSKRLIYEGFEQAVAAGVPRQRAGILVDEEFGAEILRAARRQGYYVAMPVEKSGQHEFDFEYGADFGRHIEEFGPTFVKVLVRYNPEGEAELNRRQLARLKQVSDYCHAHDHRYMFELLVPAEPAQLAAAGGDQQQYDLELRPGLMVRAIQEIQDAGVEPDVWKIEGLDRREDCVRIVAAARRGGRDRVGCIVLGRGEDERHVLAWLRTAAGVPGFIGFAVGRSSFLDSIKAWRTGQMARTAASAEIARRFREWVDAFEGAR